MLKIGEIFVTENELKVSCNLCLEDFKDFHEFFNHLLVRHHNERNFLNIFMANFLQADVFKLLKKPERKSQYEWQTLLECMIGEDSRYHCYSCRKTYDLNQSKVFKSHLRDHTKGSAKCQLCGKMFTHLRYLTDHMNRYHKRNKLKMQPRKDVPLSFLEENVLSTERNEFHDNIVHKGKSDILKFPLSINAADSLHDTDSKSSISKMSNFIDTFLIDNNEINSDPINNNQTTPIIILDNIELNPNPITYVRDTTTIFDKNQNHHNVAVSEYNENFHHAEKNISFPLCHLVEKNDKVSNMAELDEGQKTDRFFPEIVPENSSEETNDTYFLTDDNNYDDLIEENYDDDSNNSINELLLDVTAKFTTITPTVLPKYLCSDENEIMENLGQSVKKDSFIMNTMQNDKHEILHNKNLIKQTKIIENNISQNVSTVCENILIDQKKCNDTIKATNFSKLENVYFDDISKEFNDIILESTSENESYIKSDEEQFLMLSLVEECDDDIISDELETENKIYFNRDENLDKLNIKTINIFEKSVDSVDSHSKTEEDETIIAVDSLNNDYQININDSLLKAKNIENYEKMIELLKSDNLYHKILKKKIVEISERKDNPNFNSIRITKSEWREILEAALNESSMYKCFECGKQYEIDQGNPFKKHLRDHFQGPARCEKCKKVFSNRRYLHDHQVRKHKKRNFATKSDQPKNLMHVNDENSKLNFEEPIQKKLKSEEILNLYNCGSSENSENCCKICFKKYAQKKIFIRHVRDHLTGVKKCELCDREFFCERYLNDHYFYNHNISRTIKRNRNELISMEKQYKNYKVENFFECKACFKFSTKKVYIFDKHLNECHNNNNKNYT